MIIEWVVYYKKKKKKKKNIISSSLFNKFYRRLHCGRNTHQSIVKLHFYYKVVFS